MADEPKRHSPMDDVHLERFDDKEGDDQEREIAAEIANLKKAGKTLKLGKDSRGRLIRKEYRDKDGHLEKVVTIAIYEDGAKTTTVTDYSTSPATVTVTKTPP